ncbi:MAG TPA: S46 family peptidase, partial [Candidatus Aminicenantes bacterium]|nr:S46 family peptidase [Candidatus Aminicenantes bacterium]
AYTGEYQALRNKDLMAKRKEAEKKFRQLIASRPEWQQAYGDAWDVVARVVRKNIEFSRRSFYQNLRGYRLPSLALTIVQYVTEVKKPDGERLPGYHDAQLNELKFMLFSPAPVYKDLEEAVLRFGLQLSLEALGPEDEFVQAALQGKTPAEVAREVIAGTKLNDPAFRKKLIEGGEEAVQKCQDPLIQLARRVDPLIRRNIKKSQDEIESVLVKAREKIAQARFAVYGKDAYPDATFTLRLAFGVVKGYPYNGTRAPYKTTLYGLFDRAVSFDNQGEFALPQRFWERKDKLDLSTPVNFVSTCDIIGGNSGSPVINRQGEVVGLIFDGNIESLSGRFMYDDTRARAVAVHTAYIIEGLRKLYDAGFLADEIEGKK